MLSKYVLSSFYLLVQRDELVGKREFSQGHCLGCSRDINCLYIDSGGDLN